MTEESETAETEDATTSATEIARRALAALVEREAERHHLVIGLVAPIGTPLEEAQYLLEDSFTRFGYAMEVIHLSRLLDDAPIDAWSELPERGSRDYYEKRMNAGDELRRRVGDGCALAALAVSRINDLRGRAERPTAFVLRSLKHPREEALLRQVYGDAFSLVGLSASVEERRENLAGALSVLEHPSSEAELLIKRDEADPDDPNFGQKVRDVFTRADAFITVARGFDIRGEIDRLVDLLFGAPFVTPRAEEEAMRLAADASLRSAAMGRQVGAALIPRLGTPVVVGTNEVPKPGGGQFWTEDEPDFRDFQTGEDSNPLYTRRVLEEVLQRLAEKGWLVDELKELSSAELYSRAVRPEGTAEPVLKDSRAASLIEFTRCLHAEQASIVNAARTGVSTQGASLFTTTFPCHECAKIIVGAGIEEVFYIDPYPKSLVSRLYRDVIDVEPPARTSPGLVDGRLPFRPFTGVSPRRYDVAFSAGDRRVGERPRQFDRSLACPRTTGWSEQAVSVRESIAISSVAGALGIEVEFVVPPSEGAGEAMDETKQDGPAAQGESDEVGGA